MKKNNTNTTTTVSTANTTATTSTTTTTATTANKGKDKSKAGTNKSRSTTTEKKASYNDNCMSMFLPQVKNSKDGWSVCADKEKKLVFPTKCTSKEKFLVDVQRACLDSMLTKTDDIITKLKDKEKHSGEEGKPEFTEKDALSLKQNEAIKDCIMKQRKKYIASKNNTVARLAASVLMGDMLAIELGSCVTSLRTVYTMIFDMFDSIVAGKGYELSKEQQEAVTDAKKTIIAAFTPYTAEIEGIVSQFPLSLGNKDIMKIVCAMYGSYHVEAKTGSLVDGFKSDGKKEKELNKILRNHIYAKMCGCK